MIGQFNPALNLVSTQFVLNTGIAGSPGMVRSTSVTTEQNNDVRWLAAYSE